MNPPADELEREVEQARERAGLAEQQVDELRSKLRGAVEEGEAAAKRVTLLEAQLVEALAAAGRLVGVPGGGRGLVQRSAGVGRRRCGTFTWGMCSPRGKPQRGSERWWGRVALRVNMLCPMHPRRRR